MHHLHPRALRRGSDAPRHATPETTKQSYAHVTRYECQTRVDSEWLCESKKKMLRAIRMRTSGMLSRLQNKRPRGAPPFAIALSPCTHTRTPTLSHRTRCRRHTVLTAMTMQKHTQLMAKSHPRSNVQQSCASPACGHASRVLSQRNVHEDTRHPYFEMRRSQASRTN